jgi:hypothetical protein
MTTLNAPTFDVRTPDVVGPLAVFALVAEGPPALRYLPFASAVGRGAAVTELAEGASVNDLLFTNPLDTPVLLYEGEEVLGAQQNRTFDTSILVAAASKLRVPVSCVEHGRWDGTRHGEAFAPAPQAAYPAMRKLKNAQARAGVAAGGEARAIQGEVWREVGEKAARHRVRSMTAAVHDVYEHHRGDLNSLAGAITRHEAQVGALVALGGRFVVLDHVSDPDAWAVLHDPLLQGYALDALEATEATPPTVDDARDFVALLAQAPRERSATAGLGESVRFEFGGLAGTGLVHAGETVTLTAFAS